MNTPFGSVLEDLNLHVCPDCGRPFVTEARLNKHQNAPTEGVAPTEAHDTGEMDRCATTHLPGTGQGSESDD